MDICGVIFPCIALSVSVVGLERALLQYCSQPNEQPFDIKTVPIETTPSLADGPRCKRIMHYDFILAVLTQDSRIL